MPRLSLYRYGDDELSLYVFNREELYNIRHTKGFIRLLRDLYQFTNKQLAVLKTDLADDLAESKKYQLDIIGLRGNHND